MTVAPEVPEEEWEEACRREEEIRRLVAQERSGVIGRGCRETRDQRRASLPADPALPRRSGGVGASAPKGRTTSRHALHFGRRRSDHSGSVRNLVRGAGFPSGSDEAVAEHDGELGFRLGPFARRHFPFESHLAQDQKDEFCRRLVAREMPPGPHGAPQFGVQGLDRIRNRYESLRRRSSGCGRRACSVWCDHPGQRRREHESVGRPIYSMSCELELVAGRLCDSPGCAASANL